MKTIFSLVFIIFSFTSFGQSELLESIREIQLDKDYKMGESLCTLAYWTANSDGGINAFKQICSWPEKVELKLFKEQKIKKRAVLFADIFFEGKPEERIYLYTVKQSGKWLIDGIHETEDLINHFLEGYYSGHFTPFDLPRDPELEEFGKKIVSFGKDSVNLFLFLDKNTVPGSKFEFVSELTQESDLKPYIVNSYGFDERENRGYINFWANPKNGEDQNYGNITIYVSKNEIGNIKILGKGLFGPSVYDFFSIK